MKLRYFYRKSVLKIIFFISIFLIFPFFVVEAYDLLSKNKIVSEQIPNRETNKSQNEEFRGVWFSFLEWKKLHNGKNEEEWIKTINENIIPNLKRLKINNVFVHATAHGDSFYSSDLYPMAQEITKEYGAFLSYNPFKDFVDILKNNGFKVHAWINPLRVMTDSEFLKIKNAKKCYVTTKWYDSANRSDYYMKDATGRFWKNPANIEVLNFIKNVCEEIICKHPNIDGIHIDDYFYPSGLDSFKDSDKDVVYYNKVKPNKDLKSWRRDSITELVKQMYCVCNSKGKLFGVSPQGNLYNNYNVMFFDQEKIIKNGYLDYIIPQIYYGFENEKCPFKNVVENWKQLILQNKPKEKKISYYVGLASYKCGLPEDVYAGKGKHEWKNNKDILKRQVDFLRSVKDCEGYVFFSYNSFFEDEKSKKVIIEEEKNNLLSVLK